MANDGESSSLLFLWSTGAERADDKNWYRELGEVLGEDSVTDDPALGLTLDDGSPQHSRVSDPLIRKDVFCHPCRANGVLFFFFFFQTMRKDPLFPQIRSSSEFSWATHETHLGKPESSTATRNSTGSLCGRNNETPY